MKKVFTLILIALSLFNSYGYGQQITTNRNPVGLEHNMLFNATSRYTVTQNGDAQVDLNALFDGVFAPSYSSAAVNSSNPTVITIEGLPGYHTQAGAWVGWSTRYWPARKFKIEAYNTWGGNTIGWVTVADYSSTDYNGGDFYIQLPYIIPASLRFTFYEGAGDGGKFGLSEIFYIQPEGTSPYGGLFSSIASLGSNTFNGSQTIKSNGQTYLTIDKGDGTFEGGITLAKAGSPMYYIYSDNDGTHDLKIQASGLSGEDDTNPRILLPFANKNLFFGLSGGGIGIGTTNLNGATMKIYRNELPSLQIESSKGKIEIASSTCDWCFAAGAKPGDAVFRNLGSTHNIILQMPNDNNDGKSYIALGSNINWNTLTIFNNSKVAINGLLTAKKIQVRQDVWADDVFTPGYRTMSLSEVEKFIATHQHLPGIPSETEVKEKGVDIAEMNSLLLRKIEEMTLLLIEQNKAIESLKAQVDELQNKK